MKWWDWEYTYLALNLLTISFPLIRSFEWRIQYARKWRYLLPAILLTGIVFIVWDAWFTAIGVWHFNPKYTLGVGLFGLPLEEWLFFLTVPFAVVFIYEVVIYFFPTTVGLRYIRPASLVMAVFFLAVGIVFYNHLYTAITFCGAGLWLLLHLRLFPAVYQYRLWFSYLLSLIPFFGVNGVLTALPVVIYNDAENLGIRLGTIPLDDTVYSFLLLMMNLTFYEWLRRRATQQRQPIQATKVSSSA